MATVLTPLTTHAPYELTHYGDLHGEISLIENPDPFNPRYEVWMTRVDWEQWYRLTATDDLTEAQGIFKQAITHL